MSPRAQAVDVFSLWVLRNADPRFVSPSIPASR